MIPEKLYKDILKNIPIACVDVCIVYNGCILLVKRNTPPAKDQYWIPGGRVQKDELLITCAHRKALEETGILCNVGPIIHTQETLFNDGPHDIPVHSINVCFLLYPIDAVNVKLDSYSSDYKWVNKIENKLHHYVKICLSKAGLK